MEPSKEVKKLFAQPVKDTVKLSNGDVEEVWIHPLRHPVDTMVCAAAYQETYDLVTSRGTDEKYAIAAGNGAASMMKMILSIRKGDKKDSEIYFTKGKELLSTEELERLLTVYFENFDATEQELGESLRATT